MTKVLEKKFEKEIAEIADKIVKGYKPETVILFGSMATGTATEDSDIDFFIVKKTDQRYLDRIKNVRRIIGYNVAADLIVYTPAELKKSLAIGNFFTEDIIKNGKLLYEQ